MQELKRVFTNRTFLFGLIAILIINAVLFYNEQKENDYGLDLSVANEIIWNTDGQMTIGNDTDAEECYLKYINLLTQYKNTDPIEVQKELTAKLTELTGADKVAATALMAQLNHINGYDDYLATIEANKDKLLNFSIFNSADSFTNRNINKTAEDFKELSGITLRLDNDSSINAFISFRLTDYFGVVLLAIVCISFLAERKKGLWNLVYATPNGRVQLHGKRIGILFLASLFITVLLYGTNLLICNFVYGGIGDLTRPIQSIASFGKLPVALSVGEILIEYLLFRVITLFLVAILINLLLAAIENVKVSLIAAVAFMGIEYVLYTFLPVQSGFNIFKYFNVFTYISLSELYVNYLNIDLFGYPFSIRTISFGALIPIIVVFVGLYLLVGYKKKPMATHNYLGKYVYFANRGIDAALTKLHLFGMECYKVLFIQKGVVILLLFAVLVPELVFVSSVLPKTQEEAAAEKIIMSLEGEITDETYAKLQEMQDEIDATISAYEEANLKYLAGEMEYEEYYVYESASESAKLQNRALDIVKKRITELETLKEKHGISPWLLYETPYERVYGENTQNNQQKAAMIAVLCLSLLLAGIFSYEKQCGTDMLITSFVNGRKKLLLRKFGICFISSVIVWAVIYGTEIYNLFTVCTPATLAAPIQSLSIFEKFPIGCSIALFLILLYLFRLLMLCCVGCIVMFVSSNQKRVSTSYVASAGVVVIPSAIYYFIGITPLKIVSTTVPVSATSILLNTQGAISGAVIVGLIMVGIALLCSCLVRKQQYRFDKHSGQCERAISG